MKTLILILALLALCYARSLEDHQDKLFLQVGQTLASYTDVSVTAVATDPQIKKALDFCAQWVRDRFKGIKMQETADFTVTKVNFVKRLRLSSGTQYIA